MLTLKDKVKLHEILFYISNSTGIAKQIILFNCTRNVGITTARKIAMYLARDHLKLSYYKLAEYFDRDPTTCRDNCVSIAKEIKARPRGPLANKIKEIRSNFR